MGRLPASGSCLLHSCMSLVIEGHRHSQQESQMDQHLLSTYHSTHSERETKANSEFFCLSLFCSKCDHFCCTAEHKANNSLHLTLLLCLAAWFEPHVPLVHACWAPGSLLGCPCCLAWSRVMQGHAKRGCSPGPHFTWMPDAFRGVVHGHARVRLQGSEVRVI